MCDDSTPAEREVRRLNKVYDETIDCYIETLERSSRYREIIEILLKEATMSDALRMNISIALVELNKE